MDYSKLKPKNPNAGIIISNRLVKFGDMKPEHLEYYITTFKLQDKFYEPMDFYVVVLNDKIVGVDQNSPTYLMKDRIKLTDCVLNGVNQSNSRVYRVRGKRMPTIGESYKGFLSNATPTTNYNFNGRKVSFEDIPKKDDTIKCKIYQIYFNDQTSYKCNNEFDTFLNQNANHWLENSAIQKIGNLKSWNDADFVGTVSYRWKDKCPKMDSSVVANKITKNPQLKVLSLYRPHRGNPIKLGYTHHRNLKYLFHAVLEDYCKFSKKAFNDNYAYSYCNFWVAQKEVWQEYLIWAKDLMDWVDYKAPEIVRIKFNENAGYVSHKPKDWYLKVFKQPHYTHHPFFMERAVNAFFYEYGYNMETI